MNEHLKLKTVGGYGVGRNVLWGTDYAGCTKQATLPILYRQILSLKHPDFCLLKFGCLFYIIYLRLQKFNFNTHWGR